MENMNITDLDIFIGIAGIVSIILFFIIMKGNPIQFLKLMLFNKVEIKEFQDLTTEEIRELNDEDFKKLHPKDKRNCDTCSSLTSALNYYCTNKDAKEARGTSIPGIIRCPYWSWNELKKIHSVKNNSTWRPS